MNPETPEEHEKRDEQHPADADRADEQPDDGSYDCEGERSAQPAAKLVSSLVSSTASRFISA
jgi:hypothetical protein